MVNLFLLAFKNQWSAQMKKPLEFITTLIVVVLNNSFYLYGIYLLAILSLNDNAVAVREYLVSTGMVLTSWGLLNLIGGGLFQIGNLIETGELEVYLSRPQPPLLLIALSKSNLISFGEIFQGLITLLLCSLLYHSLLGIKMLIVSAVMVLAFASVIITIGSLSFFCSRGSQISHVVSQVLLSLSIFPIAHALEGREKWIFYLTPLVITATLPRLAVLEGGFFEFLLFMLATIILFGAGVVFFSYGLHFYRSKNYLFINE